MYEVKLILLLPRWPYIGTMAEAWRGGIGKYPTHPEGLGNTLPMFGGKADGRGGYCPTPQDSEGIFQYLLAMPVPLSHCNRKKINHSALGDKVFSNTLLPVCY